MAEFLALLRQFLEYSLLKIISDTDFFFQTNQKCFEYVASLVRFSHYRNFHVYCKYSYLEENPLPKIITFADHFPNF